MEMVDDKNLYPSLPLLKDTEKREVNMHLAINLISKSKSDGKEESLRSQVSRHHPCELP